MEETCEGYTFFEQGTQYPCSEICCGQIDANAELACYTQCREFFLTCLHLESSCPVEETTMGPTSPTPPITDSTGSAKPGPMGKNTTIIIIIVCIVAVATLALIALISVYRRKREYIRGMFCPGDVEDPNKDEITVPLKRGDPPHGLPIPVDNDEKPSTSTGEGEEEDTKGVKFDDKILMRSSGGKSPSSLIDMWKKKAGNKPNKDYKLLVTPEKLDFLDGLEWCLVYMVENSKPQLHIDKSKIDPWTLFNNEDMKNYSFDMIKEYMPTLYTTNRHSPKLNLSTSSNSVTYSKDMPSAEDEDLTTVGIFLQCVETSQIYAITVSDGLEKDKIHYTLNNDGKKVVLGKCLEIVKSYQPPTSLDFAIIEVAEEFDVDSINVFPLNALDVVTNKKDATSMQSCKVQLLSYGTNQCECGYIKHSVYTNKEHNIHRALTMLGANEETVITSDMYGSVVTSLTVGGSITIYGILVGRVQQIDIDEEEGTNVDFFVVLPFKEIQDKMKSLDCFQDKSLDLYRGCEKKQKGREIVNTIWGGSLDNNSSSQDNL